jgi:hypothetical protein
MSSRALTDKELRQVFEQALQELASDIDLPLIVLQLAYYPVIEVFFSLRETDRNNFLQGGYRDHDQLLNGGAPFFVNYIKTALILIGFLMVTLIIIEGTLFVIDELSFNFFTSIFSYVGSAFQFSEDSVGQVIGDPTLSDLTKAWLLQKLKVETIPDQLPVKYVSQLRDLWPFIFCKLMFTSAINIKEYFLEFLNVWSSSSYNPVIALPQIFRKLFYYAPNYEEFVRQKEFHMVFNVALAVKFVIYSGTFIYDMTKVLYTKDPKYDNQIVRAVIRDKAVEFFIDFQAISLGYYAEIILEDYLIRTYKYSRPAAKTLASFIQVALFHEGKRIFYLSKYPQIVVDKIFSKLLNRQDMVIQTDNQEWQVTFGPNIPSFNVVLLVKSDEFMKTFIRSILLRVEGRRRLHADDVLDVVQLAYDQQSKLKTWLELYTTAKQVIDKVSKEKVIVNIMPNYLWNGLICQKIRKN